MNDVVIGPVTTQAQAKELDRILWEVLWKPIGLPRDVRETFKLEGESIELVATRGPEVVGGLVAVRQSHPVALELRHIAWWPWPKPAAVPRSRPAPATPRSAFSPGWASSRCPASPSSTPTSPGTASPFDIWHTSLQDNGCRPGGPAPSGSPVLPHGKYSTSFLGCCIIPSHPRHHPR